MGRFRAINFFKYEKDYISSFVFSYCFTKYFIPYNSDPKTFIDELVNDALKILADKSITQEDKKNRIEIIAKDNVDIKGIGLYTLGSARKNLSQETLNDFNSVFEVYFFEKLNSSFK